MPVNACETECTVNLRPIQTDGKAAVIDAFEKVCKRVVMARIPDKCAAYHMTAVWYRPLIIKMTQWMARNFDGEAAVVSDNRNAFWNRPGPECAVDLDA